MSATVSESMQLLSEAPTALSVRRGARGNGRAGRQGGSYENKGEVALPGRPNGARTSLLEHGRCDDSRHHRSTAKLIRGVVSARRGGDAGIPGRAQRHAGRAGAHWCSSGAELRPRAAERCQAARRCASPHLRRACNLCQLRLRAAAAFVCRRVRRTVHVICKHPLRRSTLPGERHLRGRCGVRAGLAANVNALPNLKFGTYSPQDAAAARQKQQQAERLQAERAMQEQQRLQEQQRVQEQQRLQQQQHQQEQRLQQERAALQMQQQMQQMQQLQQAQALQAQQQAAHEPLQAPKLPAHMQGQAQALPHPGYHQVPHYTAQGFQVRACAAPACAIEAGLCICTSSLTAFAGPCRLLVAAGSRRGPSATCSP